MLCRGIIRGNNAILRTKVLPRLFSADIEQSSGGAGGLTVADRTEINRVSNVQEGRQRLQDIRQDAYMEYKEYPLHIGHWNPNSPDYVHSERDESILNRSIDGYNEIIDNLKTSLKLQEELYDAIERMDRPYLRGTPGLNKNVYEQLQDYGTPVNDQKNECVEENEVLGLLNGPLANRNRYIRDITWHSNEIVPQAEKDRLNRLDERPVNDHYHPDKGYKFDVITPYEERYPHVADRLGHPYFLGDHVDRLLRLEDEYLNPGYVDQPFVQSPPTDADPDVDFREGKVIYENPSVLEWANFWQWNTLGVLTYMLVWNPYHVLFKNHVVYEEEKRGWNLQFEEFSHYYFDTMGLLTVFLPPVLYLYYKQTPQLISRITQNFPAKIQYNKAEDLLFVTVNGYLGRSEERVIELDHVEILPAGYKIGNAYLTSYTDNGYYMLKDLNQKTPSYYFLRTDDE